DRRLLRAREPRRATRCEPRDTLEHRACAARGERFDARAGRARLAGTAGRRGVRNVRGAASDAAALTAGGLRV
ncbi:MAG: hypothetical protein O9972_31555, partial [Burkholderiales bacterium]|nr:hypothetical protein [Burkholderiales bacterium]